jgi:hypothetical protein
MQKRKIAVLALALLWCGSTLAQQQQTQPLTFWYGYSVKPGKEADFMKLVNEIGAPVRDKLMAEGVIGAWGIETPLLRAGADGDGITHLIWYSVMDWSGIEKTQRALAERIASVSAEAAKAPAKGAKPAMTLTERQMDALDLSKTRDWVTRDLVFVEGSAPPAGTLPFVRYNFNKARPGKGADYRAAWEKYNKPVLDQLVRSGDIVAFGLAVEEVRTDGNWTHFAWYAVKSLAAFDKIRAAFLADRARRTPEERDAIAALFNSLTDPDAARSFVTSSTVFKLAPR